MLQLTVLNCRCSKPSEDPMAGSKETSWKRQHTHTHTFRWFLLPPHHNSCAIDPHNVTRDVTSASLVLSNSTTKQSLLRANIILGLGPKVYRLHQIAERTAWTTRYLDACMRRQEAALTHSRLLSLCFSQNRCVYVHVHTNP